MRRALLFALAAWAAAAGIQPSLAQRTDATESGVKAAYLFRFAGYVEWPEQAFSGPDAPLVIGVMGAEDVAADLASIAAGRRINGRSVEVRRPLNDGEGLRGVHLLFVGRELSGRLPSIVRIAQSAGALIVADSERGLEAGSAINFVPLGDRIGFEVSLEAAERSGHKISSRMLAVARRVVPRGPS